MIKSRASELTNLLISLMQLIGKRHLGHRLRNGRQDLFTGLAAEGQEEGWRKEHVWM